MDTRTDLPAEPEPFVVENDQYMVDSDAPPPARPWRTTLRRQFMPLPVAAGLWAAAEAAHALPAAGVFGAISPAAIWFVAAMGYWKHWADQQPEATRRERRRWSTTVILGGGAWLLWAATFGPSTFATLVLAGAGAAAMIPYWTRNSPWQPDLDNEDEELEEGEESGEPAEIEVPDVPELDTVEVVEPELTANQLFWDTVVVDKVQTLRGTRLIDPVITSEYEEYTVQVVGGSQTTNTVTSARDNIISAFGGSADTVQVTRHPSGRADLALVRLSTANTLAQTYWYPDDPRDAIDMTGGNIRTLIGYRSDGTKVWWRWYVHDFGMLGGAVFGATGSGKSELMSSLICSAYYTGVMAPVVACPQNKSYPIWRKGGHWPASSADEVLDQARALWVAHETRTVLNELWGWDVWRPSPTTPLIPWFVDEIHTMRMRPEFYQIADDIDRAARATGIRLVAGDQNPSVPDTFGNKPTLRDSLLAGQAAIFRINHSISSMVPGMKVDPTAFPLLFPNGDTTAGLGVMANEDETYRALRMRNLEKLAANIPTLEFERTTAKQMGNVYTERFTRKQQARAERVAKLAERDPELLASIAKIEPDLAAQLPKVLADRERRRTQAATPKSAEPSMAAMPPLTVPKAPRLQLTLPPQPQSAGEEKRTWTCLDKVEEALRKGITQFGEIHKYAVGPDGKQYVETSVRNALKHLVTQGRCRDGGQGRWEYITPAA